MPGAGLWAGGGVDLPLPCAARGWFGRRDWGREWWRIGVKVCAGRFDGSVPPESVAVSVREAAVAPVVWRSAQDYGDQLVYLG